MFEVLLVIGLLIGLILMFAKMVSLSGIGILVRFGPGR